MKKSLGLLLLFISVLTSCSSSDDSSSSSSGINPPNWLLGSWYDDEEYKSSGFKFTKDDLCTLISNADLCYKEQLRLTSSGGGINEVEETSTEDSYSIKITMSGYSLIYSFDRISDTVIDLTSGNNIGTGDNYYYKQ